MDHPMGPDTPPWLSLEELEQHDPQAPRRGTNQRFLCPLPACATHQDPRKHRNLSVELASGAWKCHRCGAHGQLVEFRPAPRWSSRRERARSTLASVLALPTPPRTVEPEQIGLTYAHCSPLPGTPGAAYLAGRGIPPALADAALVRYATGSTGRAGVIFPVIDGAWALVALACRYLDAQEPKARSVGAVSSGVFVTLDAFEAEHVAVCEAPIDALSLALVGVPALALIGTGISGRAAWLPRLLAFKTVSAATDADAAGDRAAEELSAALHLGTRVLRLRPPAPCKDWNEVLTRLGVDALRALVVPRVDGRRTPRGGGAGAGHARAAGSLRGEHPPALHPTDQNGARRE
jgi:hypothetical protein